MNFWPRKYRAILGAFVVASFAAAPSAKSCGDFRKPETHFDGVNEYGFVSYWDQLGEIKLTDGSVLPLIIGFRSDWETLSPSPHLGSGWLFGLLDAHFVQRSENAFDMISIDGYTIPFGRDPKNPSILNGAREHKAELKGDTVNVWANCGWKFEYVKGKIASLTTPKNRVIQIRRGQDGSVTDVIEGTNTLLKIERDAKGHVGELIPTNGKKIKLQQVEKPLIQSMSGINVVGTVGWAIGKITYSDGKITTFNYSPNNNMEPSISINDGSSKPRVITWNPASKLITADGIWTYKIAPPETPGHNASIERSNNEGGKEFWHYNQDTKEEIIRMADGTKVIKRWFTSGKLADKLRRIENYTGETIQKIEHFSYNEKAYLIRNTVTEISSKDDNSQMMKDKVSIANYSDEGRLVSRSVDGVEIYRRFYDAEGRIREERYGNGDVRSYGYENDLVSVNAVLGNGKRYTEIFNSRTGKTFSREINAAEKTTYK